MSAPSLPFLLTSSYQDHPVCVSVFLCVCRHPASSPSAQTTTTAPSRGSSCLSVCPSCICVCMPNNWRPHCAGATTCYLCRGKAPATLSNAPPLVGTHQEHHTSKADDRQGQTQTHTATHAELSVLHTHTSAAPQATTPLYTVYTCVCAHTHSVQHTSCHTHTGSSTAVIPACLPARPALVTTPTASVPYTHKTHTLKHSASSHAGGPSSRPPVHNTRHPAQPLVDPAIDTHQTHISRPGVPPTQHSPHAANTHSVTAR